MQTVCRTFDVRHPARPFPSRVLPSSLAVAIGYLPGYGTVLFYIFGITRLRSWVPMSVGA